MILPVASGWQNKLHRISRMDWEEIQLRAQQGFHKQSDLLRHRLGMGSGAVRLPAEWPGTSGQFFFASSDVPDRIEMLRQHLPEEAARILHEADEICSHRFHLLGYQNLEFGKEIDWHLDPVHGKRAPLDPWFKIPFLDFAAVGDHKVAWELNRHQHLMTLAKAHLLSRSGKEKQDRYLRELIAQWHSWIKANPYPLGINWASTLEVAFRSLSWIGLDQLLAGTPEYDQFRLELLPALAFHGRYIERYLSTYFSPNTHLIGEAVALFFIGTLYPQMPGAPAWKQSGWRIVLHEAERQMRPDGVYFEQSLHYHVYALDFFLHARLLAARNSIDIPSSYDARLERMLDVIAALSQAGPAEGFGDDDGGRVWNPRRNRIEHMTDPLALGALTYSKNFPAAQLTEEAIWLFGAPAVEKLAAGKANPGAHSIAFPDGGLYVLADSEPYAQAMMVDAGPQGVGRSGHGHADALSVRLTLDGRRCLVDSGSGVYISEDPANRNRLRGTGAHNTMSVDGVDQAVAGEPFSWIQIPITQAENWIEGKTFTYFAGSHNGYARLADPVVHRRHILKIAGGPWLVRDLAQGRAEHELEIRWHFAPDLELRDLGAGRVDAVRASDPAFGVRLSLLVPVETVWQMEVGSALISPAYGALQPAPLVRCQARAALPAETATVLRPARVLAAESDRSIEKDIEQNELRLAATGHGALQVYELRDRNRESDNEHKFCFALGDHWNFGSWSSDARVLYYRTENEKLEHLVAIGGSNLAWEGKQLLQSTGPIPFFEWRRQDGMRTRQSEFPVTSWFEELTGAELARNARS
jgi:hypothetical protein